MPPSLRARPQDFFAEIYRNQLAKRLLNNRSTSDDAERSMISKLKLRCGEKDEYEKWAKPLRALCPDADAEAAEARLASRSAKFRADVGEMKKVLAGVLPKETTEGYLEKKRGGKKGEGEGDDFESGALPALLTDGSMGLSSCETLPRPSDTTAAGSPVVSGALPAMEKKASSVESSTGVVKALETATGALWRKRYFVLPKNSSQLSYYKDEDAYAAGLPALG